MKEKNDAYKFKTNLAEDILFQSGVVKEGEGQYGKWKMFKIQVKGKDYVFFPSEGLQRRLDQIGNLEGKTFNIGKYESDDNRTYWQIFDPEGNEIDYTPSNYTPDTKTSPRASGEATSTLAERLDKASIAFKEMDNKLKELDVRVGVLEMEIKELRDNQYGTNTYTIGDQDISDKKFTATIG